MAKHEFAPGTRAPGFQKGKSGNPGGRPGAAGKVARMVREQTGDGQEIVDFVLKVFRGHEPDMSSDLNRRWATDWLSDRCFGKAPQVIEVSSTDVAIPDVKELSRDELLALAAADDGEAG